MESLASYGGWPLGVECAWPLLGEAAGDKGSSGPHRLAPGESATTLTQVAAAAAAEAMLA
ncbi:MAG TPA: hypothetical protein PKC23_09570 [Candidatus Desulfobacillus sp.]|nr:hypothetical protein [Candidatus Desulfobacillus sp.]